MFCVVWVGALRVGCCLGNSLPLCFHNKEGCFVENGGGQGNLWSFLPVALGSALPTLRRGAESQAGSTARCKALCFLFAMVLTHLPQAVGKGSICGFTKC